jgi:hypothetical protein
MSDCCRAFDDRRSVQSHLQSDSQQFPQPGDFNDAYCRQDRTNQPGVDLVEVMLTGWFGHELLDAIRQSALGYQIRVPTISRPDALIPD